MEKEKEMKGAFVERDLSWMYFNHRILQEAEKKNVPILERMSFLGIYSNNLDEFFRVRMASLNRIALSKDKNIKQDRERAKKTIKKINHLNACYNKEFEKAVDDITEELEKQGIRLLHENELNEEQQLFIRRLYLEKLNGSTNPIWLSQVKEIGATGDDGIFLAVKRMEVLTPVYDEELQHDLERTIDYGLRDTTNARIVDGRGGNQFKEGAPFRSQEQLYVDYLKESQEMNNVINQ